MIKVDIESLISPEFTRISPLRADQAYLPALESCPSLAGESQSRASSVPREISTCEGVDLRLVHSDCVVVVVFFFHCSCYFHGIGS